MTDRVLVRAALGLVAAAYVVTLAITGTDQFWIGDEAVKFLQLEAVLRQGPTDPSLAWAGAAVDPTFESQPLPPPFAFVHDGRVQAQYAPTWALVSALPYLVLGRAGLYLVPLASTLVLLAGAARLVRLLDAPSGVEALAVLLAGLSTPLWFYAVVFWEHAPASCLAVWAVVFHLEHLRGTPRALVFASALAAASVWFREEQVLLVLLLAIFAAARDPRPLRTLTRIGTVTAAVLVPLAAYLWVATGSPFGLHVAANVEGFTAHVASRLRVFENLWLAAGTDPVPSWLLTLPAVLLLVAAPSIRPERSRLVLGIAGLLGCAITAASLAGALRATSPIAWLLGANSLFPAAPIVLLGLVGPRSSDERARAWRRIHLVALAYAALYTLAAPSISSAGIHWGNRFLLPLYPLLAVLGAAAIARTWHAGGSRAWLTPVAGAVLVGVAAQLFGLYLLDQKKDFSRRLAQAVRELPAPAAIVTDQWWIGGELHAFYAARPLFFVRSTDALGRLRLELADRGLDDVLLVRRPAGTTPHLSVIDDGPLAFFSVALERRTLP